MNEQEKCDWMVYVSCATFNHATYIVDAMNGFTIQETNFPYVCAIIDDASTDGEQEVIKNYLNEHFALEDKSIARHEDTDDYVLTFARHKTNLNCYFAVLYLKYNHYSIKKSKVPYISQWRENAKYIAVCEGDDYWIDNMKLQVQADYMEQNPNCSLCYAKAKKFNQKKGRFIGGIGKEIDGFKSLLLNGNSIPTLTVLYRLKFLKEYSALIKPSAWLMGDYPLWLYYSTCGVIHFYNQEVAVYRVLKSSASHFVNYETHVKFENSLYDIQKYFAGVFDTSCEEKRFLEDQHNGRLFRIAYDHREYKDANDLYKVIKNRDFKMRIKYIITSFRLWKTNVLRNE